MIFSKKKTLYIIYNVKLDEINLQEDKKLYYFMFYKYAFHRYFS